MSKIISAARAAAISRKLKSGKKKVVFTNGTFDLLHLGHVSYLQKAKAAGDVLMVGVNSDRSVKSYKHPDRPLNPQNDRMRVLSALSCVDHVILFDKPTPKDLIVRIRPDVLVKGADWKKEQIAGAAEVESWGGKVKLIKLVSGRSTTALIQKIRGRHGNG